MGGPVINRDAVERLIQELTAARIDVLILDPLGAMHTLPENDNSAANLLLDALREIATRSAYLPEYRVSHEAKSARYQCSRRSIPKRAARAYQQVA